MASKIWIVVGIVLGWWFIGRIVLGGCKGCGVSAPLTDCGCTDDKKRCQANLAGYQVPRGWDRIENCVEGFVGSGNAVEGSSAGPACETCPSAGYDTTHRDIFPLYLQEYKEDQGCLRSDEWCFDKPFRTDWVDPLPGHMA